MYASKSSWPTAVLVGLSSFLPCCDAAADTGQSTFTLQGTTVYNSRDLLGYSAQVLAQREGQITADALARTIQTIYREDGYFLAEVFVARDGMTLLVDEGEIGTVVVEGVDASTFELIKGYFRPVTGRRAVTQDDFERAIMLTEDIGSISARAEIDYPAGSEEARVTVLAEPVDANRGWVTLDHPARQLGDAATLSFHQEFHSSLTAGDLLEFDLSATEDFETGDDTLYGSAAYRFPLGSSGGYGEVFLGNVTASRDASGALVTTDLAGNTAIIAYGFPVIRDVERFGYTLLELRRSETEVNIPGSTFDSGVDVLGASWIFGKALPSGGAWEYALNLSFGRRTTNAAGFDDGDEDFAHLRFGFGAEVPLESIAAGTTLRAELWGQYSPDRLPSIEEFHLGGREDERGYVFAEAQGDSGVSATLEIGRDMFPSGGIFSYVRPFGFIDAGYVSNNAPSPAELDDQTFASLGVGADVGFDHGLSLRSYVAVPLIDGPSTNEGDPALYLSLTKTW